ncbi:MAG: hypothetical protein M0Z94_14735 [Dehalococcoidales bacterium]|nr:hypothetical protein [Dehalococcoidales bacterium]
MGGGANGSALACDSNYPNMANSWMVYGPFSLAGATAADFSFNLWQNIPFEEGSYRDRLSWLVSVDGTYFYGWSKVGATSGWEGQTFDLTTVPTLGNVTGQSQIWVALQFHSNETGNNGYGSYVDDIVLRKLTMGTSSVATATDGQETNDGLVEDYAVLGEAPN